MGDKTGLAGDNGQLFYLQLDMCKELASRPGRPLLWVVMENSKGLTHNVNGENAYDTVQRWWAVNMPGWTPLVCWCINGVESSLAQTRVRSTLVSFSRRFSEAVGGVPSAPPPHAPVALEDMLMDNSTITDLSALTCGLRRNICFYNKWLNSSHDGEGLACANIDRSPGNKFCPRIMVHKCPTLTTANTCLFVMKTRTYQTSKVAGTGRWVTMEERANLSGVVWSSILDTGSDGELLKSLGNMFPVDMAGRTLWPIMMCMSVWQSKLLAQGLNTLNMEGDNGDEGVNCLEEGDSCLEGVAAPSKRRRLRPSLRAL